MHARILGSVDGRDMGPRFERATLDCKVQVARVGADCRVQELRVQARGPGAAGCSGQGVEEVWQVQSAEGGTSKSQG